MQAGTIALILNILFVVMLVIGFLMGMWRGVKKASINFVFSCIGVIIAFFCCSLCTRGVLNIQVTINGEPGTLNDFLVSLFSQSPDIAQLINTTPSIETFIAHLPFAICNVIFFILLALVVEFVMYILYAIFSAIVVKKKDKDGNKLPKRRISGGIIGLIKAAVIGLFMIIPFVSLTGTVSDLTYTSNDIYAEEVSEDNSENNTQDSAQGLLAGVLPEQVVNALDGFNTSAFGVIGNMFGLDNAMFDYLSAFQIEEQTVYIRQEIVNYNDIYSAGKQLQILFNGNSDKKFADINFEKLDKTIDAVLNSGLYKSVVSDVLTNIIVNYNDYEFIGPDTFGEYGVIFEDISKAVATFEEGAGQYLAHDLQNIYQAYKELAVSGALDKAREGKDINEALSIISGEYYDNLVKSLNSLLTTNIVKDSTANVADLILAKLIENPDNVAVNGRELTDEEYTQLSTSIANVIKDYSSIATQTDLMTLLSDPMSILSKDSNVNIQSVFNALGELVDNIRDIKIFKNEAGNSVLDKLLSENGFELPKDPVVDSEGNNVTISNYTQLMNFISPSLSSLRDIEVYELLTASEVTTSDILKIFANACAKDKDILVDIILPLQQVEPTKTLFVENLLKTLDKTVIDFSILETPTDWKTDLGYISTLLTTLNKGSVEGKTYLDVMLTASADTLLLNLGDDITITDIMTPLLYAKSTDGMKEKIFGTFESVFNALLESTEAVKFDFTNVTLTENNANDQTAEICAVFEEFVNFYGDYQPNTTKLEDLDKIKLGKFLDALKENAYRTTLLETKTEEGLFATGFTKIVEKLKEVYEELKTVTDYANTNFTELFTKLAEKV